MPLEAEVNSNVGVAKAHRLDRRGMQDGSGIGRIAPAVAEQVEVEHEQPHGSAA